MPDDDGLQDLDFTPWWMRDAPILEPGEWAAMRWAGGALGFVCLVNQAVAGSRDGMQLHLVAGVLIGLLCALGIYVMRD